MEACRRAVAAWNAAASIPASQKPRPANAPSLKPRPIPVTVLAAIAVTDDCTARPPAGQDVAPLLYKKARAYYDHDHYLAAVKVFAAIASKHARHALAEPAAMLLLDSLNILRRYDDLGSWVKRLLDEPAFASRARLREQLHALDRSIQRQEAAKMERGGDYQGCGEKYAQLAQLRADFQRVELLYNAAVCFDRAKLIDKAAVAREELLRSHPRSALAPRTLLALATAHEAAGKLARAADQLEEYVHKFPGEREAPDALLRAMALHLKLDQKVRAQRILSLLKKLYGRRLPDSVRRGEELLGGPARKAR